MNLTFFKHFLEHFELPQLEILVHCRPRIVPISHHSPTLEARLLFLDRLGCQLPRHRSNSYGMIGGVRAISQRLPKVGVLLQSFRLDG